MRPVIAESKVNVWINNNHNMYEDVCVCVCAYADV